MSNISAGQHIFGNVEKAESPSNIRGFQTLFYSKEFLSESESDEIEGRLGYYSSEENPEKLIFFTIGEKVVTTQIVPLEGLDKFGRTGTYIAHSFVFLKKDFEKFNNNPFVIFDLNPEKFVKTLQEALTKGKKEEMNIPLVEFTVNSDNITALEREMDSSVKKWISENVKKLVFLAMNEQKTKKEAKSFIISGNQNDIRNTIKAIFALTPDIVRSACTFDTHFVGCNPITTRYWTYCYPKAPNLAPQVILVNTETRIISNVSYDPESPYEKWICGENYSNNIQEWGVFRNTAFELDQYLTDKAFNKEKIVESVNLPSLETFLEDNKSLLHVKLQKNLKEIVSDNLVKYVIKSVITEYKSKPNAILLKKLLIGFEKEEIANYLFNEIKSIKSPEAQEINELKAFLTQNPHKLLLIVHLKWTKSFVNLTKFLKTYNDDEYKIATEILLGNVELNSLIIDTKIPLITEIFVKEASNKKGLLEGTPDLIKALLNFNQEALLLKIIPLIPKLNQIQIISVRDFIAELKDEKRKKIPDDFIKTLTENIEKPKENHIEKPKEKGGLLNLDNLVNSFPFFKKK